MNEVALHTYLEAIENTYRTGNATEHTYRSDLKNLLESLAPGITATNEPKRIACGAPDFIIVNAHAPLGYIETKDIGVSLDHTARTEQMKRYLAGLTNLILTDYLEFRWYVSGQHRMTARLAKVAATGGRLLLQTDDVQQVADLLHSFLVAQVPTIGSSKELATRMAAIAQLMRNAISRAFESEDGGGSLHTQMEGFRLVLLPDLSSEQFADMYAQTICYGLFAARCHADLNTPFTREHAAYDIPKTNPFLRKMFNYIAGPDLDERLVWAVDDLAEVLNRCDMEAILRDFGQHTRQEDPVVHFYETFLAAYDPKLRETRGVYYTPEPVVSYMVRSVDYLLKKDFALADGLADASKIKGANDSLETHKVQILDPATGTGTFLYSIMNHIHESFKGNKGMWSSYVSQHLLPRLFGFELLMAPYAVAHMKLGLQLAETGYDFSSNERLGVYLTNTLEEGFQGGKLPFVEWLVEEATAASSIKYDAPVMVVIGNPPYSGHSANKGKWISNLLRGKGRSYFEIDGIPLGERNPKWLNDDYVKFIRFAQWRIERTGYGILAFITNHGYLDNPTFRGMRHSLMQSFDEIYVLDLHGNSKRKERSPDGSKDENVFDIQQGVAIGIFVRWRAKTEVTRIAKVRHAHLWGPREVYEKDSRSLIAGKYHWLAEKDITTTAWTQLEPTAPFYLFTPQNNVYKAEYEQGWKVTEIFPVNSIGITTARDDLTIRWSKEEVWRTINRFVGLSAEEARQEYNLGEDARDWQVVLAQQDIKSSGPSKDKLTSVLYRPFDVRYTYYTGVSRGFHCMSRTEVMHHMLTGNNMALATTRSVEIGRGWEHMFCSNRLIQLHTVSLKEVNYLCPLYLYPDPNKTVLVDTNEPSTTAGKRRPNLSPMFIAAMERALGMVFVTDGQGDRQVTFGPEDVFEYMYAVFHSPTYRSRYAQFLKIDFPRLPLTSNTDLFRALCVLGEQLIGLHLMEKYAQSLPTYPVSGNNVIEKIEYTQPADKLEQGRVWINKTQYFEGVAPAVWEFQVGGYQVCQRWLKDRKGRELLFDELKHYQRTVAALAETRQLMQQIDEAIEEHGGWPTDDRDDKHLNGQSKQITAFMV